LLQWHFVFLFVSTAYIIKFSIYLFSNFFILLYSFILISCWSFRVIFCSINLDEPPTQLLQIGESLQYLFGHRFRPLNITPYHYAVSNGRTNCELESVTWSRDCLCGLVVRVLGYRSHGPGSIPGTTRKKK
jgi:hypothetical protein